MTYQQIVLFSLFGLVLAGLIWGRFRYDLVAFTALIGGVLLGVVPPENAFAGFGNTATIVVALVLVLTAGLSRSGAVDMIARTIIDGGRGLRLHIGIMGAVGAAFSAFMNNVAALSLLMPVELHAARRAGRPVGRSLMPLSFATILGGLVTLIGTPPNIVVSGYRRSVTGQGFSMFDFTPIGAACAVLGVAFIALIGWRLIPPSKNPDSTTPMTVEDYVTEMIVTAKSKAIGQMVRDLDPIVEEQDCVVLGLVRKNTILPGRARRETVVEGDMLVVQGSPDGLNGLAGALALNFQGKAGEVAALSSEMALAEAVITSGSKLVGRSSNDAQIQRGFGLSLLGISRNGKMIKQRIRRTALRAGDVLLLLGPSERIDTALSRMGCLPLAGNLAVVRHEKAWATLAIFATAVTSAALGILDLPIAFGAAAIAFVLLDILPVRELYDSIEWPVIVLLAALIPLGTALDDTGGTALIAGGIAGLTSALPAWVALAVILIVTMTLSDVLNNTATAVVSAPIAYELARVMGVNPDAFLMAVAIGASCAFLTPIGHQNNMLILGPGGYAFSDYWRLGLPLEILICLISIPLLLIVFPL